ncbi:MAG TPA: Hpt domain-containing protein, partial [Pseudomonadales bacterium]|nr:Hpt domain-containing protein [Pseudomonadales bacterium]
LDALRELKEVMEDEFDILIDTYLNDSVVRIASLKEAVQQQNPDAFRKAAHSFKGSCGNIGANGLAALCKKAEDMGAAGDLAQADSLVVQIETVYADVKSALAGPL